MPDSGLGGIRSALTLISDSTRDISAPGRSAFISPRIPSRVYWIVNHLSRHASTLIGCIRRIGPTGSPIQSRIGQTETLIDHRFLGLGSGQLRDGIGLIQTQLTSREPGTQGPADPATGGPPAPAEPQSNDADQTGPTPTPEDSEPHPPRTTDPDPPRSTIRMPRPELPRKDSENDRSPVRSDHSNTPSPCHPTYKPPGTNSGQKPAIRREISEIPGRELTLRRTTAPVLPDPDWPGRTRHAAIPGLDRSRPRPGWSLLCDSRP